MFEFTRGKARSGRRVLVMRQTSPPAHATSGSAATTGADMAPNQAAAVAPASRASGPAARARAERLKALPDEAACARWGRPPTLCSSVITPPSTPPTFSSTEPQPGSRFDCCRESSAAHDPFRKTGNGFQDHALRKIVEQQRIDVVLVTH